MLKIRLTRIGKKHQPSYRIVVTPKDSPVKGQYLELLGTYNPLRAEVALNSEKAMEWLNKGAKPSDRVARLMEKAGLTHKSIVVKHYSPKPVAAEPKAEPVAEPTPEPAVVAETETETVEAAAEEVASE